MLDVYERKSGNTLTYSLKSLMIPDEPGHHITGEKTGLSQRNLPTARIASVFPDMHGKYNL